MECKLTSWFIGLAISLVVGHMVTSSLLVFLRRYLEKRKEKDKEFSKKQKILTYIGIDFYPPKDPKEKQVPYWITGPAERLFFTIVVAFNIPGAAVAMVGWITLKMISSRPYREKRAESVGISPALPFEMAGLLGNLLSMLFALVGGLIILKF